MKITPNKLTKKFEDTFNTAKNELMDKKMLSVTRCKIISKK